jgi:hypothetical protein
MMRPPPAAEPEIPAELSLPLTLTQDVPELAAVAPGQLFELPDGQQVILLVTSKSETGITATVLRVTWPREAVLPLGETFTLHSGDALAQGPLRVLGAWFAASEVPKTERVVLEAIRRGFITGRTCGVPWPLSPRWQLSEQAAEQIEKYLFEVARSTGVAFPFHDITAAMRKMHLHVSLDNPGLCDIVPGDNPGGRQPRTDEEMLSVWARELQRRVHSSEIAFGAQTATEVQTAAE